MGGSRGCRQEGKGQDTGQHVDHGFTHSFYLLFDYYRQIPYN
jgi:hypothetical protein